MQKYQNDVIENPDDYSDVGELDGSFEQSENSVNRLISFIDE